MRHSWSRFMKKVRRMCVPWINQYYQRGMSGFQRNPKQIEKDSVCPDGTVCSCWIIQGWFGVLAAKANFEQSCWIRDREKPYTKVWLFSCWRWRNTFIPPSILSGWFAVNKDSCVKVALESSFNAGAKIPVKAAEVHRFRGVGTKRVGFFICYFFWVSPRWGRGCSNETGTSFLNITVRVIGGKLL